MAETTSARGVRLRHYQGQRLVGADLQDEYAQLGELRGLHVRALHDTWGIALGFDVQLRPDGHVLVGPGFAYDALARELVLAYPHAVPGPELLAPGAPGGPSYELVLRYDAMLSRRQAGQEPLPCAPADGPPGREQPVFAWRRPGETRLGLDVPLVRLHSSGGVIAPQSLDGSVRRYTRPLARPHVAAGITPLAPEQVWDFWQEKDVVLRFALQTHVDTRDAGFVGAPYYLAALRLRVEPFPRSLVLVDRVPTFFLTSLADAGPSGFTFRVAQTTPNTLQGTPPPIGGGQDRPPPQPPWQISWLGIEPVAGCPPSVDWSAIIAIFLRHFRRTFVSPIVNPAGPG